MSAGESPRAAGRPPGRLFLRVAELGTVPSTLVVTGASVLASLLISVTVTAALRRLSLAGVMISIAVPSILVPLTWYPFLRVFERLKSAESRLRASEERYRTILAGMDEAYLEIDPAGRLIFCSEAFSRITGFDRAELERRPIAEIAPSGEVRRLLEAEGRPGSADGMLEFAVRAKSGAVRTLEASFSPVPGDGAAPPGFRAVVRDVTERLDREREKQEYEERLQRARKMEALGTLAGGVAHDLNNILSGLIGYPELLLLDVREEGPLRSSLLAIKESGEKAARVVQDLLTLSRRGVVVRGVVSLNQVVADYLASPEHALTVRNHPGVEATATLDPSALNIEGSGIHLSKTVMNLVLNAFEAVRPPGTVTIATGNRYLDAPLRGYDRVKPGDYVTLTVSDSGEGIAAEDLERIFEPFYTKKAMGRSGSGLGMAVVWGTVKDHEGYLDLRSEVGKGTSITLFFPATRKELPEQAAPLDLERYRGHGESILVVDDMEDQRVLASRMLERLGYTVAAVSSGEEAVEHLKRSPVDLLLLDMIMDPGMDGLETCRAVSGLRPGQRVIIASGYSETSRVREALRLVRGAYLRKPYLLESLARIVHETLATRDGG